LLFIAAVDLSSSAALSRAGKQCGLASRRIDGTCLVPLGRVLILAAVSSTALGCGNSATPPMAPTTPAATGACSYLVSPIAVAIPHAGGTSRISVTPNGASGCLWTASTPEEWIRLAGATSGQGAGVVEMAVASAGTHAGRATVSWAGGSTSIDVLQCGAEQTLNLNAERQDVLVRVSTACHFEGVTSADVPWIRFFTTQGNGTMLLFLVEANAGPERIGHITTSLRQITIIQGPST